MHITSAQNPRIKHVLRLLNKSGERQESGQILVEGRDEIRLALAAGARLVTAIAAPDLTRAELDLAEGEQLTVTAPIFSKLSMRENPDGWLAVFERPRKTVGELTLPAKPLLLLLEAIEKPGNLGAILRTADAAGVNAVLVCGQKTDVYGPNVVRASRGALFCVPIVELSATEAAGFLRNRGIQLVAANANSGIDHHRADLRGPIAIAMGTEDTGLSNGLLEEADVQVRIPMHGKVNSLNVSVAAALLLYEALRQRM